MSTPEEDCKCERDGFFGAISTQHCKIHTTPDATADYNGKRYVAKEGKIIGSYPINTPDAEWEKELRKKIQMFFYNAEHPEVYSSYEIAMFERKVEGILSIFQNTVSSRDTYWKERVEAIIRMADELELECGRDGDKGTKQWMAFKGFRNTIRDRFLTNEDNLK